MDKILFVAQEGLNKGGVQTVIMSLVENLSCKYQIDIVLFTSEERYYDKIFESYGGRIYRIAFLDGRTKWAKRVNRILKSTVGYFLLKKIIRNNGPYKAIHCHNSIESVTALRVAKNCGIRNRINQVHVVFDDSSLSGLKKAKYDKTKIQMAHLATASIGCSKMACESFFKGDYQIILNPYNEELFKQTETDTRKFDSPVIVQVGNLSGLKNQIFTLKVFNIILQKYPNAHLNFIGPDCGAYASLKAYIAENNMGHNVTFFAPDVNIPKIMQQSSCLVLPSLTESFGIVLVEAQAMGLKCFASDKVPQEANAGGCVYLPIGNTEGIWADAIESEFAISCGTHKKYDVSKFSSKLIAEQIDKLYNLY